MAGREAGRQGMNAWRGSCVISDPVRNREARCSERLALSNVEGRKMGLETVRDGEEECLAEEREELIRGEGGG